MYPSASASNRPPFPCKPWGTVVYSSLRSAAPCELRLASLRSEGCPPKRVDSIVRHAEAGRIPCRPNGSEEGSLRGQRRRSGESLIARQSGVSHKVTDA